MWESDGGQGVRIGQIRVPMYTGNNGLIAQGENNPQFIAVCLGIL